MENKISATPKEECRIDFVQTAITPDREFQVFMEDGPMTTPIGHISGFVYTDNLKVKHQLPFNTGIWGMFIRNIELKRPAH